MNYCTPIPVPGDMGFWLCPECKYRNRRPAARPFTKICDAATVTPRDHADRAYFIPERTDSEVLVIITNYCTTCPAWNPKAEKKKCKYCGCGSSDTVENLHRRRVRNCPRGHWTEASLQAYLHPNNTSSTDFEKSP